MLKVWLPLDGDLRNLGTDNITFTQNTGATVTNTGKIGQCYSFDGNDDLLQWQFDKTKYDYKPISVACWFKCDKIKTEAPLIDLAADLVLAYTYNSSGIKFGYWLCYANASGTRVGASSFTSTVYNADVWHHVVVVFGAGKETIYVDGKFSQEIDHTASYTNYWHPLLGAGYNKITLAKSTGTPNTAGTNYWASGLLNDVRIYDHCLSAAEVREIAMGLVLHYKLDKNKSQLVNVYNYPMFDTSNSNGGWSHWGQSGASGAYGQNTDKKYIWNKNNTYSHWVSNSSSATGHYLLYQSPAFDGGYRSTQCIVKEENGLPITTSIVYATWNAQSGGLTNNTFSSITHLGDGFYLCKAEGIKQDGSNDLVGFYVRPGYKVYFSEAYLENDKEICSDVFEQDNLTTIEDNSGYGHNGTINGTLTTSSDTAKYNNSCVFNGTDNAIQIPFNDIIKDKNYTVSVWTYKTTIGTKGYQTILGGPGGFELEARSSSSTSPLYRIHNWGGGTTPYEFNKWNLFTFVHSDNNSKLYVNGELKITGTSVNIPTGNYYIGAWNTATQQNYEGQMSDFRIYCTPLLDNDIKMLYNIGMKVDNLGEVHTFEFNENQSNLMWRPENARAAGLGMNYNEGLGSYTQSNCQVTCDSNGYRIYRPPNLTVANNGNTMWGGLKVVNSTNGNTHVYNETTDNIFGLTKGHTYIIILTVKGKSGKTASSFGWTNQMGWGGGGLSPNPSNVIYKNIENNFNGETECYYKFTISDDIVKTCTTTYSGFTSGNQYLSYRDFMFGFGYESTESLGTDLYISNIRLFDLTNKTSKNIQKSGIIEFTQFIEKEENITKIRNDEELYATEFIEI